MGKNNLMIKNKTIHNICLIITIIITFVFSFIITPMKITNIEKILYSLLIMNILILYMNNIFNIKFTNQYKND